MVEEDEEEEEEEEEEEDEEEDELLLLLLLLLEEEEEEAGPSPVRTMGATDKSSWLVLASLSWWRRIMCVFTAHLWGLGS